MSSLQIWRTAAAADYAFMTSEGGRRVVLFYHKSIGPKESCKGSYFLTAPSVFLHGGAHHYRCQNLCLEYELWLMGRAGCGRRTREGAGRRRGDAQVSAPPFWPVVTGLGHFSIQEGPIGALITQAPVAQSSAQGEERCDSLPPLPLPLPVCRSSFRENAPYEWQ